MAHCSCCGESLNTQDTYAFKIKFTVDGKVASIILCAECIREMYNELQQNEHKTSEEYNNMVTDRALDATSSLSLFGDIYSIPEV